MKQVNIVGQIFGTSGYSIHTRQLANALNKYIDVKLITQLPQGWERVCNDNELKMITRNDSLDAINLIIDLPMNWSQHLHKKHNIGFLVFEGDKIPLSWVDYIKDKRVTQVWVPSQHVYNAIKNTCDNNLHTENTGLVGFTVPLWVFIKDKIKIVPHGVDLSVFFPQEMQEPKPFTFLCNKGFRGELDRGGVQHAIKAFMQEFTKGEARLIVKINPAYALHPDELTRIMNKYRSELNKTEETIPEILFTYENLDYKILNKVYNSCDVFLSPTEGEAFSLPCLEAMACGKPVITTNFGGQTDFVNSTNGYLVSYTMHPVVHEILYEGIQWATPNMDDLRKKMRETYSNSAYRISRQEIALKTAKMFTWDNSAQKAVTFLKEIDTFI